MAGFTRDVKKLLKAGGCSYKRAGKGDHEIWWSPISGKCFTVDANIKSRHTANGVLKEAGLEKGF